MAVGIRAIQQYPLRKNNSENDSATPHQYTFCLPFQGPGVRQRALPVKGLPSQDARSGDKLGSLIGRARHGSHPQLFSISVSAIRKLELLADTIRNPIRRNLNLRMGYFADCGSHPQSAN